MYYIFKNNGECIASCNNKPNIDDLESRNEIAVESNENYNISEIKLDDGNIVVVEPTQEELNKIEAVFVRTNLRNIAVNAMMMNLADDDLTATKTEYQMKLRSISDGAALLIPEVFPHWNGNSKEYVLDDKVLYNNVLYKVITAHTSQESWTPEAAPSLFVKVLTSEDEILEWEQPSADNAYMKGDKVRYNGKVYESLIDNNVWSPIGYPQGWKEVEE